jgi:hypothetical protein
MGDASGRTYPTMGKKATKRRMRTIRLMVIPEPPPGTRSVFRLAPEAPGTLVMNFTGRLKTADLEMVCGNCGAPLVRGVNVSQFQSIVFVCNGCGMYNDSLS